MKWIDVFGPPRSAHILFGVLSITLPLLFLCAYLYTIPSEDAVILYGYARNLATRGVITYSVHQIPIEGATDFLWMVAIAGLKFIGVDEFASALLLNVLGILLMLHVFHEPRERIIVCAALLATPYLYASLSGFSAIFFSACYVLALRLTVSGSPYLYFSILALCLIRPDGAVWGVGCMLYRAIGGLPGQRMDQEIKICLVSLIAPGIVYFAWRCWYFGELLPLPFTVKSTSPRDFFVFYAESIRDVMLVLFPGAVAILLSNRRRQLATGFLTLFLLPAAFYSAMRLEQNIGNRFVAPLFFGIVFLLKPKIDQRALLAFLFITIVAQAKLTVTAMADVASSRRENVYYLSRELGELHGRMLTTEAGRLAYYSNWFSEDSWGLNTPRYAHSLITAGDVVRGNYDLIVAHCDLEMLRPESDLAHNRPRTWVNQCKSLVSAMREGAFAIYLIPYFDDEITIKDRLRMWKNKDNTAARCRRYDIYAVSEKYPQARRVEEVIKKHGGMEFDVHLDTREDMVCKG